MAVERTFGIIKPDAVASGFTGEILSIIERNGFTIVGMEKRTINTTEAESFYGVHKSKPFFGELVSYITSGPVIVLALERENAIQEWRNLMGATDPLKASVGTLRKMFGKHLSSNATHGSDAPETAKQECAFFFPHL
ncbi:MAG: Nucleoside diphosphate kinase [candidate division TM6 bacterium GW2011_GWE2_42_60]|nr:MAG: Nucleoside diphosphate kinase [candidate division TM6 bacterium GW2011_GWE2_42_60]HBY05879.1 nucleoside-diphosphate kinase [Candidatus Dependentiae bacterium]